jgi:hypothetical protein
MSKWNRKTQAAPTPINQKAELDVLQAKVRKQCEEEVNSVLRKHGCVLAPRMQYVPDGTGAWKLVLQLDIAIAAQQ